MEQSTQHILELLAVIITSFVASSGFWLFLTQKIEKKSLTTQLLLGLAHDRIIYLGMIYIQRGYITNDEYDNIHDCIFKPYQKMGGNGFARRLMNDIEKLPIRNNLQNGDTSPVVPEFLNNC